MLKTFQRFRVMQGLPVAKVIKPISTWTLPAGYTLDLRTDQILDGSQNVVTEYDDFWETQTIDILTIPGSDETLRNAQAGLLTTENKVFYAMNKHKELLQTSFAVYIDNVRYTVDGVIDDPLIMVTCRKWT